MRGKYSRSTEEGQMRTTTRPARKSKDRPPVRSSKGPRRSVGGRVPSGQPLPLEELARLPTILFPKLSWQRDRIGFYWDRTGQNELYVQPAGGGDARQVSHGEVSRSVRTGPIWDREGTWLAFTKDQGGDEKFDLYRIQIDTGEVQQLSHQGADMGAFEVSPDNHWVLILTNATGRGGKRQLNVWRVPADGGAPEQLTDYDSPVGFSSNVGGSPDGRSIAYSVNESSDLKNTDVYVCRADGADAHRVFRGHEGSQDSFAAWHPDGRRLAITSDTSGSQRPGVLNLRTGEAWWMGRDGVDERAIEFSPDGQRLLTLRTNGVAIEPQVYDLSSGRGRGLPSQGGVALGLEFAKDSQGVVCWYTNPVRRPEITLLQQDQQPAVVRPAEYGGIDRRRFVACRTVRYPSFDGRKIEALLYAPSPSSRGVRLPAIVEVHGGPTGQYTGSFDELSQHLVSRGFVVLQPNVRGSTGYGAEFRDLNRTDWGGGDLKDIVAGRQYLAELPFVDPERIGVWGGSYGGFMTYLATVKEPELWKAACAWVGISDLERLYEESREHYRYYFREQMGDPNTHRELWRDRSAIRFADRLRARLLMVHGVNDPRCPVDQARLYRDRLIELGRKEGTDFEYVELTEEGHGSSDIEQKFRSYRLVSDFFAKAL